MVIDRNLRSEPIPDLPFKNSNNQSQGGEDMEAVFERISLQQAQSITTGNPSIAVAVIDSG
jgi:hypothetical protein